MENPFDIPPEMLAETAPVDVAPAQEVFDPRKRLKYLLSIPERERSDEQWDEIIELEIQLAPGNRADGAPFSNNRMRAKNAASVNSLNKKRPRTNNFRRMRNKPNGNNPAPAGF